MVGVGWSLEHQPHLSQTAAPGSSSTKRQQVLLPGAKAENSAGTEPPEALGQPQGQHLGAH